jgi:hypothetical protein
MAAARVRVGVRAITMQQPFAAAMVGGQGLFTRRGKAVQFGAAASPEGGEWLAIQCGQNDVHLKNVKLMAAVRTHWPGCPSDEELRADQKSILGFARFVDGGVDVDEASSCFFVQK